MQLRAEALITQRWIPELLDLDRLAEALVGRASLETLCTVRWQNDVLPVRALTLGAVEPDAPVLLCVGGVHGLERIGAQVVLGFIETLVAAQRWDRTVGDLLRGVRICFLPVLNPIGVLLRRRSNGDGVDLMRNAPVEAERAGLPWALYRGQRWSAKLPWYRGHPERLEPEAQALCDWFERQASRSRFILALDVHSGFVGADRLWFPYARTRTLFPHVAEVLAFKQVLDETYPRHRYVIEPQSLQYTTHGDLWDYIYDAHRARRPETTMLPLTLELGASSWLKKSWRVLDKAAFFHPLTPHRTARVLRRHVQLFELLLRATYSWDRWAKLGPRERTRLILRAQALWT